MDWVGAQEEWSVRNVWLSNCRYNDCDLVLLVVDTLRRPDMDLVDLIRRIAPKPDLSKPLELPGYVCRGLVRY